MDEISRWLIPLLAWTLGPGGIVAVVVLWRKESLKAPIERQDSNVANAIAISTTANAMYQTVTARLTAQDLKVEAQDAKIDSQDIQIDALRTENAALRNEVESLKTAAAAELKQRGQMIDHVSAVHDWIESGAKPPPPDRPYWAPRKRLKA